MVVPAGLVFFRAVVMVDRVEHAGGLLRRRTEQQGGFATVGSDFDTDAAVEVTERDVVECTSFVGGHEPLHLFGQRE